MKTHHLKTWPNFFNEVASGVKTFEIRKNDRDFREGDILVLQEWLPGNQEYSGRELTRRVAYLLIGWGLQPDYVCMSLGDCH